VEETHQEVNLYREKKMGEIVQESLVKDLHHVEVVVQHSLQWQDMIPPSTYWNSRERH
jgi:hypothetical protein